MRHFNRTHPLGFFPPESCGLCRGFPRTILYAMLKVIAMVKPNIFLNVTLSLNTITAMAIFIEQQDSDGKTSKAEKAFNREIDTTQDHCGLMFKQASSRRWEVACRVQFNLYRQHHYTLGVLHQLSPIPFRRVPVLLPSTCRRLPSLDCLK